jgi:hypothetical protein
VLSRIMRHPAGLVKKALAGRFLASAWSPQDPAADPPAYWAHRYSGMGLLLASAAPAPQGSPIALVHALHPEDASLPAQGGKASSFLSAAGRPADRP